MSDDHSDKRTEIFLCKRRVDASTSQLIEEDIVSLKSAKDSTAELLAKAKKTLGDKAGESRMKILDLFCGQGGWSIPFIEDGDDVTGVDIVNLGYPGKLIQQDIRELNGKQFFDYNLIIGSPPCNDFSTASLANKTRIDRKPESKPDPYRGMELFGHALRIIGEAKPRFWALENVWRSRKFIPSEAQWTFKLSPMAKRLVWTNIPLLSLAPDHVAHRKLDAEFKSLSFSEASQNRARIPYPIARFIADCVKQQIVEIVQ